MDTSNSPVLMMKHPNPVKLYAIPQGWVIGPILFLLIINEGGVLNMYSDYVIIYTTTHDL